MGRFASHHGQGTVRNRRTAARCVAVRGMWCVASLYMSGIPIHTTDAEIDVKKVLPFLTLLYILSVIGKKMAKKIKDMMPFELFVLLQSEGYTITWISEGEAIFENTKGDMYTTSLTGFILNPGCSCPSTRYCKHWLFLKGARPCDAYGCNGTQIRRFSKWNGKFMYQCTTCQKETDENEVIANRHHA